MNYIIFLVTLLLMNISVKAQEQNNQQKKTDMNSPLVSQRIPNLSSNTEDIIDKLMNTIWTTRDIPNSRDLYVFFVDNKYGNIAVPQGSKVVFPKEFFPMKFVQKGPHPHSSIYIIPSKEKVLYYTFYLLDSYHLVISAGYESIEPLTKMDLSKYLEDGYIMQLIY